MSKKRNKNSGASSFLRRKVKKEINKKIRRMEGIDWTSMKKSVDPERIYN